ncbi:MAG: hypothetical protein QXX20_02435 [Candidatus Thermoplasmatota archaeon]
MKLFPGSGNVTQEAVSGAVMNTMGQQDGWKNFDQSTAYIRDQARHHNAYVIDEKQ